MGRETAFPEAIEQDYERWRANEPLVLSDADRQVLHAMDEDLPGIWNAPTTTWPDRKNILRLVIREVIIDQKRLPGQVWFKIVWQSEAASEHHLQRHVRGYDDYFDEKKLRQRVTGLNALGKMDKEVATLLNAESFISAHGGTFAGANVWLLRKRWGIPTVKINGLSANPTQWPDATYSVQGAAELLGVIPNTVFKYLARELIRGKQLRKGQPWKITLSGDQIEDLRALIQRNRRSRRKAS